MSDTELSRGQSLLAAWQRADALKRQAADMLAYDVTFRAEDPTGKQHEHASEKLTADLKSRYVVAHAVERAAWDAMREVSA